MGGPGSGGHRVRSGPAANPAALRNGKNATTSRGGWIHLPATGREGQPPAWPLSRPTKFEATRWEIEWRRPQAIMWERLGLELDVALYVRTLRRVQEPKGPIGLIDKARTQGDRLGISVPGLASNHWIIDEAAVERAAPRSAGASARDRFRTIQGGAARAS